MGVHVKVVNEDGEKIGEWITENDGTHRRVGESLTFAQVSRINADRANEWHRGFPDHDGTGWTGADWSNAMCGEAGEAANVVKKLRRNECGLRGNVDADPTELVEQLASEIADVILYADLLATKYGIDVPSAIISKFNEISEREGLPQRLEP
jgi:NTP pyrophosphatase (non-canonical NTP hydrolase)